MKQVCVPNIGTAGLLTTSIGVGLAAALVHSIIVRVFIALWPMPPVPMVLAVFLTPMLVYGFWTFLLSLTIEHLTGLFVLLTVCMVAVAFMFGWTVPLAGDDGGTSLRDTDQLVISLVGPLVIGGLIWLVACFLALMLRRLVGKPRPWTPDACPKCLYELGDDKFDRCPECGTEPVESSIALSSPARWADAIRKARWYLVALPLVICAAWTAQQVVTRTLPILRFEAVMPGRVFDLHPSFGLEPLQGWQRALGTRVAAKSDRGLDGSGLASILYKSDQGLVTGLYLYGRNDQDSFRPGHTRDRWVCAELSTQQTKAVLREGSIPNGLLETMHALIDGHEVTQWVDPSPYFPSN